MRIANLFVFLILTATNAFAQDIASMAGHSDVLVWVVGGLFVATGCLIKYAVDKNTDELKGLRGDVQRLFNKEEQNGRDIVSVRGDIRTINERCKERGAKC